MSMANIVQNYQGSHAGPARRGAAVFLAGLSLIIVFGLSDLMLTQLGIEYGSVGGSPLEKIHPATYAAILAFGSFLLGRGDPVGALSDIVRDDKPVIVFFLLWCLLLADIAFVQRTPFTAIIDTFLLPMLLAIMLPRFSERAMRAFGLIIHLFMALNAIIALIEFAIGDRITPIVANGQVLPDWRSTALLGHPLANAAITGVYMLALMYGGGRDMPRSLRSLALILQFPAFAVFGGRASLVLVGLFALVLLGRQTLRLLDGEKTISLRAVAILVLLLPVGAGAIVFAAQAGFFDRFAERFVSDDGSAQTRIDMFIMLSWIPVRELFFGPDPDLVATLQRIEGLEFGIESFWVGFVAFYGILVSAPFLAGLLFFLTGVVRKVRSESAILIVFFLLVASTSASISGKTTSLAIVITMVLVLMRRPATHHPKFNPTLLGVGS